MTGSEALWRIEHPEETEPSTDLWLWAAICGFVALAGCVGFCLCVVWLVWEGVLWLAGVIEGGVASLARRHFSKRA